MQCSICGYEMPFGETDCARCEANKASAKQSCAHCGTPVPASAQTCPFCFKSTAQAAAVPAQPPGNGGTWAKSNPASSTGSFPTQPYQQRSGFAFRIPLIVLAVLLLGGGGYYYNWTRSPVYSLWQARAAVQAHDLTTFERYVDIKGVVDAYLDDEIADKAAQRAAQGADPQRSAGLAALSQSLKSLGSGLVQNMIRDYVSNRDTSQNQSSSVFDASGAGVKRQFEEHGLSFKEISYVKSNGGISNVGISFASSKGSDYVIDLEMRWGEGHWRVVKCTNALDIYKRFIDDTPPAPGTSQPLLTQPAAPPARRGNATGFTPPSPNNSAQIAQENRKQIQFIDDLIKVWNDEQTRLGEAAEQFANTGDKTQFANLMDELADNTSTYLSELDTRVVPPRLRACHDLCREALVLHRDSLRILRRFADTTDQNDRSEGMRIMKESVEKLRQGAAIAVRVTNAH